jgi:hypothetical protein
MFHGYALLDFNHNASLSGVRYPVSGKTYLVGKAVLPFGNITATAILWAERSRR